MIGFAIAVIIIAAVGALVLAYPTFFPELDRRRAVARAYAKAMGLPGRLVLDLPSWPPPPIGSVLSSPAQLYRVNYQPIGTEDQDRWFKLNEHREVEPLLLARAAKIWPDRYLGLIGGLSIASSVILGILGYLA